jgi:hypothetical protein
MSWKWELARWNQNGPGSKSLNTGTVSCDRGHEDCHMTEFYVVHPVPRHQWWQCDKDERYVAEREWWHLVGSGRWVVRLGYGRTQRDAKKLCTDELNQQYGAS